MKKKKTPAKDKTKPSSAPLKALDSRNWISESSVGRFAARAAEANPSSSGGGSGDDPCKTDAVPPKSVENMQEVLPVDKPNANPGIGNNGETSFAQPPTIKMDVFCDGSRGVWVRRITKAFFQQRQKIRAPLLGVTITDQKILAASCDELLEMGPQITQAITDLDTTTFTPRSVIQAHEDVHAEITREILANLYPALKAQIDAISVPCKDHDHAGALKATDQAVTDQWNVFSKAVGKAEADNVAHTQKQRFLGAQRTEALVWYNKVRARISAKHCPETLPDLGN